MQEKHINQVVTKHSILVVDANNKYQYVKLADKIHFILYYSTNLNMV